METNTEENKELADKVAEQETFEARYIALRDQVYTPIVAKRAEDTDLRYIQRSRLGRARGGVMMQEVDSIIPEAKASVLADCYDCWERRYAQDVPVLLGHILHLNEELEKATNAPPVIHSAEFDTAQLFSLLEQVQPEIREKWEKDFFGELARYVKVLAEGVIEPFTLEDDRLIDQIKKRTGVGYSNCMIKPRDGAEEATIRFVDSPGSETETTWVTLNQSEAGAIGRALLHFSRNGSLPLWFETTAFRRKQPLAYDPRDVATLGGDPSL